VPSFLREASDTQEPYGAPLQPNFRGSTLIKKKRKKGKKSKAKTKKCIIGSIPVETALCRENKGK